MKGRFDNEKFDEAAAILTQADRLAVGPERDAAVDAWLSKRREGHRLHNIEFARERQLAGARPTASQARPAPVMTTSSRAEYWAEQARKAKAAFPEGHRRRDDDQEREQ